METDRRRLEDVVTLVLKAKPGTSRTALVKLLYFIDLRSWEVHARPLTSVEWIWHWFGPFAEEIGDAVGDMEVAGELDIRVHTNFFGHPEFRIQLAGGAGLYGELDDAEESLIQEVVDEMGAFSPSVLSRLSYQT